MCGLVGMVVKPANGLSVKTETIFNQLLYADAVRGEDSTGIIGVETDTTFHTAKEATAAAWFLNTLEVESKLPKKLFSSGKAVLGHNRKKTMGKIEDASAHPFVVNGHFAMSHNGTLFNHKALANTDVDSEALAIILEKAFDETDRVGAVGEALSRVNGAYAVSIYDQRSHSVHLIRNDERPLAYAETSEGWFWASEAGLLYWILSRNGLDIKEIKNLKEDVLLTIDLDTNMMTEEPLTIKKQVTTTTTTATTATVESLGGNVISKRGFKKLQRALLNTTIDWWPDDFVSTIVGGTSEQYMLMGESFDFQFEHTIKGNLSLKDTGYMLDDLDGAYCRGDVYAIDKHKVTNKVTIWVNNITPYKSKEYAKNIAKMSREELKKYQLKKSSSKSIFSGGIQGVEDNEDEHRTNAV